MGCKRNWTEAPQEYHKHRHIPVPTRTTTHILVCTHNPFQFFSKLKNFHLPLIPFCLSSIAHNLLNNAEGGLWVLFLSFYAVSLCVRVFVFVCVWGCVHTSCSLGVFTVISFCLRAERQNWWIFMQCAATVGLSITKQYFYPMGGKETMVTEIGRSNRGIRRERWMDCLRELEREKRSWLHISVLSCGEVDPIASRGHKGHGDEEQVFNLYLWIIMWISLRRKNVKSDTEWNSSGKCFDVVLKKHLGSDLRRAEEGLDTQSVWLAAKPLSWTCLLCLCAGVRDVLRRW